MRTRAWMYSEVKADLRMPGEARRLYRFRRHDELLAGSAAVCRTDPALGRSMSPAQLRLIHSAVRQVQLNDPQYRMLLKSVAGVDSSKLLDNSSFEDVMAVLEDMGFGRTTSANSSYWRNIVENRGVKVGSRMVHKIRELAATEAGRRYTLAAMVSRFSDKRTEDVEQLLPREAWKLIEGYKAIVERG